jgi:hypothetical protein
VLLGSRAKVLDGYRTGYAFHIWSDTLGPDFFAGLGVLWAAGGSYAQHLVELILVTTQSRENFDRMVYMFSESLVFLASWCDMKHHGMTHGMMTHVTCVCTPALLPTVEPC